MKTINEIQDRIHELKVAVAKGWAYNALERYHKEKKDWGEADYGETSAAHSAVAELENQITALKWVLEG
jgi:cellulase/cellobiase CelA1